MQRIGKLYRIFSERIEQKSNVKQLQAHEAIYNKPSVTKQPATATETNVCVCVYITIDAILNDTQYAV